MAKIKNYKPKKDNSSGGYLRLYSDQDMSNYHTAVHSTVIRNGNELVTKMINHYQGNLPVFKGKDVNLFQKTVTVFENNPNGCIIVGAKIKIEVDKEEYRTIEIDLIIFYQKTLVILELKDGNNFDTKKSPAEIDSLFLCKEKFNNVGYTVVNKFVSFNSDGTHSIKDNRIHDIFQNGVDFCNEYNFDFDGIINERELDTYDNRQSELKYAEKILRKYKPDLFK